MNQQPSPETPESPQRIVNSHEWPQNARLVERLEERGQPAVHLDAWSEATNQQSLLAVYAELMEATGAGVSYLSPARVLDACLTPEEFHFLLG
jgi:hypothetical protein